MRKGMEGFGVNSKRLAGYTDDNMKAGTSLALSSEQSVLSDSYSFVLLWDGGSHFIERSKKQETRRITTLASLGSLRDPIVYDSK